MAPTSDVIFDRGLDRFGEVLDQVPADGWELASPCEGWTVLDVLGHLSTATEAFVAWTGRDPR